MDVWIVTFYPFDILFSSWHTPFVYVSLAQLTTSVLGFKLMLSLTCVEQANTKRFLNRLKMRPSSDILFADNEQPRGL